MSRPLPEVLAQITEAIRAIRFGSVHIVIHDSQVVQIEKAEKIRLPAPDALLRSAS